MYRPCVYLGHIGLASYASAVAFRAIHHHGTVHGRLCRANATLHLHCVGGHAFDAAALRCILLPCGGSLLLHREAGTLASHGGLSSGERLHVELTRLLHSSGEESQLSGGGGTLAVRCSRGIDVVQLVGGAVPYEEGDGDDGECGVAVIGRLHRVNGTCTKRRPIHAPAAIAPPLQLSAAPTDQMLLLNATIGYMV